MYLLDWLVAQVDWLGPKVGGHWRCSCIHRVKFREPDKLWPCSKYDDSTINIVPVLLLWISHCMLAGS